MTTGLVWHDDYAVHDSGMQGMLERPHPYLEPLPTIDHPLPKRRMKNLLDRTGLTAQLHAIAPRPATREELLRVHTSGYLDRLAEMSMAQGGDGGQGTPFGPGGFDTASLAAGGVLAAIDAVMTGRVGNAYALIHPPGHHARPAEGIGFCLLANGALGALHAQRVHGAERVAIVDWDVHHGNSAQEVFWEDPSVLAVSLHQADWYPPASGPAEEIGGGAGEGFTLNIPLPPGSGEAAYRSAMERIALPALRAFRPDLILVASGYDAGLVDPLGRMRLNSHSFAWMMAAVRELAEEVCEGRIVVMQEGGYDPTSVPFHGLATIEALSGLSAGIDNPFAFEVTGDSVRPHEEEAIAEAERIFLDYSKHWPRA